MPGLRELKEARQEIIEKAQEVYDEWEQDDEGVDEVYGCGGICRILWSRPPGGL